MTTIAPETLTLSVNILDVGYNMAYAPATESLTYGGNRKVPYQVNFSTVSGNNDSDTVDRGSLVTNESLLTLVSTAGGAPTTKVDIQGSADGVTFWNVLYALVATPATFVNTQITISSSTANHYIIKGGQAARFIKFVLSSNNNVEFTTSSNLIVF